MDKAYAPHDIERRIYEQWESRGWFAPSGRGSPFCIMIPPPNVTGTLHMGHAFQHTLMDALTRYHRMRGDDALWQPGTDHAGIATQMVVERQLEAQGRKRSELSARGVRRARLGMESTVGRHHRRADAPFGRFRRLVARSLHDGSGPVTRRHRGVRTVARTGPDLSRQAARQLGPGAATALSDLEVESEEEEGHLWHLQYPFEDGSGHVVVATTRPETMLGDTAVAVNPDDERYKHLIGKKLLLPLTERSIPVIADKYVDAPFGSGS